MKCDQKAKSEGVKCFAECGNETKRDREKHFMEYEFIKSLNEGVAHLRSTTRTSSSVHHHASSSALHPHIIICTPSPARHHLCVVVFRTHAPCFAICEPSRFTICALSRFINYVPSVLQHLCTIVYALSSVRHLHTIS